MEKSNSDNTVFLFVFCIVFNIVLVIYKIFIVSLSRELSSLVFIAQWGLCFIDCLLIIVTLYFLLKRRPLVRLSRPLIGFILCSVTVVGLYVLPITNCSIFLDFKIHENNLKEVVMHVQKSNTELGDLIKLPEKFSDLSQGGEIAKIDGDFLFYVVRGIDDFSGYVYAKDNLLNQSLFNNENVKIIKLKDHWYWVNS